MTIPDILDKIFEPDFYQFFTDSTRENENCKIAVIIYYVDNTISSRVLEGLYLLGSVEIKKPVSHFIIEVLHMEKPFRSLKLSCEHEFFQWHRDFKVGDRLAIFPDARIYDLAIEKLPSPQTLRRKSSWQTTMARPLAGIRHQLARLRRLFRRKS